MIEASGGRSALIEEMHRGQQDMARSGAAIVRADIEPPDRILEADDVLFAIVRQTVVARLSEAEVHAKSYLIGVARKGGGTWKFVDGAKLTRSLVEQFFPNFPSELELPEVAEPRLVPAQPARD